MAHKQHILIVDDNFINRQFFTMTLKKANFNISTAEDGYDAIEQASKTNFDLILMDIRMPGIDGYATAKQIKLLTFHHNTPILATSAEELSQNENNCFNGFLLKPISPQLLANEVHKNLSTEKVIFNQYDALKFAYHDTEIMNNLLKMFSVDLPFQTGLLKTSFMQNNASDCIDIIHKIRGSCKACGAQELNHQLEKLSTSIKNKGINSSFNSYEETKIAVSEYLAIIN